MSKRIFLDVGANTGQTLAAVLDSVFRFDEIYCFEPASACWPALLRVEDADTRVFIVHYGLWNKTCEKLIIEPGSKGASLYKKDNSRSDVTELCWFMRASDWFKDNIVDGDIVFLKLNCEGAECDILDDLLDSGQFKKVSFAMIHFDVRKISSQKHRQAEVMTRLNEWGYKFPRVALSEQVMIGATHQDSIKHWLRAVE